MASRIYKIAWNAMTKLVNYGKVATIEMRMSAV